MDRGAKDCSAPDLIWRINKTFVATWVRLCAPRLRQPWAYHTSEKEFFDTLMQFLRTKRTFKIVNGRQKYKIG